MRPSGTALEEASEALQKPNSTDAEKAVALCWVFHLVGDVHQPLHAVSVFSALYPEGDRGGTRFYVRVGPGSATVSLHYLWDNALGQEQGVRAVWNRSGALVARAARVPAEGLVRRQVPAGSRARGRPSGGRSSRPTG